jgi:hypothetical protein
VNSILILAEIETTLRLGFNAGKDDFDEVKQVLESADIFPIGFNAVDRVRRVAFLIVIFDLLMVSLLSALVIVFSLCQHFISRRHSRTCHRHFPNLP